MFAIHPRFWLRLLVSSIAVTVVAFGIAATGHGGWGPCGPSSGWGFLVAITALLSAATAAAAVPGLLLSAGLQVLLRARQPRLDR